MFPDGAVRDDTGIIAEEIDGKVFITNIIDGMPASATAVPLLYLAVADVLVDGQRLEGIGVEPDILVPFDRRYADGNDPQLNRAIAVAATAVGDAQK
jgi:C-terminal processing protease CtpA/Prc